MEVVKNSSISPLASYGSHELVELMAIKDDIKSSHQAFNEFYKRFRSDLFIAISMICRDYSNKAELIPLIENNTLINAYQYSHSFGIDGETNPSEIDKRVLGWLIAIAKTELKAQFYSKEGEKEKKERSEEAYTKLIKNGSPEYKTETSNEKIVREAFEQIPKERDRDIFRTYWLYYDETPKGQAKKLPPFVLTELCLRYETTDVNIRQIISRCKKIVFAHLSLTYKK